MDYQAQAMSQMNKQDAQEKKKIDPNSWSNPKSLSFSSYDHIGDLGPLKFAVSLRETKDVDALIQKILPMAFIKPGVVKPREFKKAEPALIEEDTGECEKPECLAVKDKILEISHSNDSLKKNVAELELSLTKTMSKIQNAERANKMLEDGNKGMKTRLMDVKERTERLQDDVDDLTQYKESLQDKIGSVQQKINDIKEKLNSKKKTCDTLELSLSNEVQFGKPFVHHDGYSREEELAVRKLGL